MTKRVALYLCSSALGAALFGAGPASAQTAPQEPVADQATQADEASGVQDIIVTAQRRSESVQKSSLSIEVLAADELVRRGVAEAGDLTKVSPSITISQNGVYPQTNIRGAGDNAANGLAQPAISYSVDGVVVGQTLGVSQNFYDLARVEIVQGPQGTLYGRNATAGAVNLITNRPTFDFGGYLTGEYGNFDSKRLTGALNLPLSETVAMRMAFNWVDRDGYLSDGTNDDVRQSGRLQAYWEPSDRFNLRLSGDYSHTGGKGAGIVLFPRQPGTGRWTAVTDPINNTAIRSANFGLHIPFLTDARLDLDQFDVAAEANIKLGDFATLTILPAYRDILLRQVTYNFGMRAQSDPQTHKQTTIEARLGNATERLKWVLGAFFYNEDTAFYWAVDALVTPNFINNFNNIADISSRSRSYAAFGEATQSLTDRLRIIGGLRYTRDRLSYAGTYTDVAVVPAPGSPFPQSGRRTFEALTWKAGLELDVAAQSMAYLTASRGYKSGGFFYVPGGSDNSYEPETLDAFDLGLRNRLFDNRLQVNLGLFYWRYRNQQLTAVGYTASGAIAYVTRNAGRANPYGANVDVVWKPSRLDTLNAAVNFTRARYDEFVIDYPAALIGLLRAGPLCRRPAAPVANGSGSSVFRIDCAGAPLQRTPKWSGSVSYERRFQLANDAEIVANLGATWASSRYLSADFYVPESRDGGYAVFDTDLTYKPAGMAWSVTAFMRNIGNRAVYQGGAADAVNGFDGPASPTFYLRTINPPRTYGVRATVNF